MGDFMQNLKNSTFKPKIGDVLLNERNFAKT